MMPDSWKIWEAAPDLYRELSAVRELIAAYNDELPADWPGDILKRLDSIDAALAKARGEESQ